MGVTPGEFDLPPDTDPMLDDLAYAGGTMPVFHPQDFSPVIDSSAIAADGLDQRRRLIRRLGFGFDIGAVEVQQGVFGVDTVIDDDLGTAEEDEEDGFFNGFGDFSLRNAVMFSEANPKVDVINFDDVQSLEGVPKLKLTRGEVQIGASVFIEESEELCAGDHCRRRYAAGD